MDKIEEQINVFKDINGKKLKLGSLIDSFHKKPNDSTFNLIGSHILNPKSQYLAPEIGLKINIFLICF